MKEKASFCLLYFALDTRQTPSNYLIISSVLVNAGGRVMLQSCIVFVTIAFTTGRNTYVQSGGISRA